MDTSPQPMNQMTRSTAITFLLVIVVIILGAGAYLLFFQEKSVNVDNVNTNKFININSITSRSTNHSVNNNINSSTIIKEEGSQQKIDNEKFGFSISLPSSYKVEVIEDVESLAFVGAKGSVGSSGILQIENPTSDGSYLYFLFTRKVPDGVDGREAIGPLKETKEIKINNKISEIKIYEGNAELAYPGNTVIQTEAQVVDLTDNYYLLAIMRSGGDQRTHYQQEFEDILKTISIE